MDLQRVLILLACIFIGGAVVYLWEKIKARLWPEPKLSRKCQTMLMKMDAQIAEVKTATARMASKGDRAVRA